MDEVIKHITIWYYFTTLEETMEWINKHSNNTRQKVEELENAMTCWEMPDASEESGRAQATLPRWGENGRLVVRAGKTPKQCKEFVNVLYAAQMGLTKGRKVNI